MKHRLTSMILALAMLVSLLPVFALPADAAQGGSAHVDVGAAIGNEWPAGQDRRVRFRQHNGSHRRWRQQDHDDDLYLSALSARQCKRIRRYVLLGRRFVGFHGFRELCKRRLPCARPRKLGNIYVYKRQDRL